MTKRDFELIANVLLEARRTVLGASQATYGVSVVLNEFLKVLPSTNANFDPDRFLRAALGK